jgi:hypothetical protein
MSKGSKTQVMTLDDLKNKDKKVILNNEEYVNILERIFELNAELEKATDENEITSRENLLLQNEIKNLVVLCKNYKNEIENKGNAENALKKSLQEMQNNQKVVNEEIAKKQQSKYSKMNKDELERLLLERFNSFKNTYKNDL